MSRHLFECNSCSYAISVEEGPPAPDFCPMCRGRMFSAGETEAGGGSDYTCGECGYGFRVPEGGRPPYKCGRCNFTFPSTPGRKVEHKL